jgi:hypothetical protein
VKFRDYKHVHYLGERNHYHCCSHSSDCLVIVYMVRKGAQPRRWHPGPRSWHTQAPHPRTMFYEMAIIVKH